MLKRLLSIIISILLIVTMLPAIALGTSVTLVLSSDSATVGTSISASGSADPNEWVSIKVVDSSGGIAFYDAVKSSASGDYSCTFIVPQVSPGTLTVVAGYGSNVDNKPLTVTPSSGDKVDECFIATAAFGSKFEPSVVLLRSFRDTFLLSNVPGRAFVDFYYLHSPPIASYIANSGFLKAGFRVLLTPVVGLVYLLFHPLLIPGMIGLFVFGIVMYRLRKRRVPSSY